MEIIQHEQTRRRPMQFREHPEERFANARLLGRPADPGGDAGPRQFRQETGCARRRITFAVRAFIKAALFYAASASRSPSCRVSLRVR